MTCPGCQNDESGENAAWIARIGGQMIKTYEVV
jgi:hypothetical protein